MYSIDVLLSIFISLSSPSFFSIRERRETHHIPPKSLDSGAPSPPLPLDEGTPPPPPHLGKEGGATQR